MESDVQFLDQEWCGVPIENLKIFNLNDVYPPVKPANDHTVLFKVSSMKSILKKAQLSC